jgi:hypothetical protein
MIRSLLVLAFLVFANSAFAADGFVAGIDDLPLMPGLSAVDTGHVDFDSPGGRIVISYAKGTMDAAQVTEFYAVTLPQLGWTRTGDTSFRREAEILHLDYDATPPSLTVRFSLTPLQR